MEEKVKPHLLDFFLYIGGILVAIVVIIFLFLSEDTKETKSPPPEATPSLQQQVQKRLH